MDTNSSVPCAIVATSLNTSGVVRSATRAEACTAGRPQTTQRRKRIMDTDNSRPLEEIADTWIAYHLWRAAQPRREHPTDLERKEEDAQAEQHGRWAWEAVHDLVHQEPEKAWLMIQRLVDVAPDDMTLANVAAGPLEDLLGLHSYAFIDRVENQARMDAKFRRCLSGVWGWSSIPDDVQVRMRRTWEGEDPL